MKIGIIDVGGGFRDIYGCGVLDGCMDLGIRFDYAIGVSAGSANLAAYLAGQRGRNYRFYTDYGFRKEYGSFDNYFKKHSYLDLDYIYGALSNSNGEYPLDYRAMMENPAEFTVVACDARDGSTVYLDKSRIKPDHYDVFKASSALPVVCPPYPIGEIPCFDGGIADPVPVAKAFADGCDRVVLILSKTRDTVRVPKPDRVPSKLLRRRWPAAAERLALRYKTYNDGVALAREYEKQGKLLIIAPDDCCGVSTIKRTVESLDRLYQKGLLDAAKIGTFLADTPENNEET